jgi:hypothetical protein
MGAFSKVIVARPGMVSLAAMLVYVKVVLGLQGD